MKEYVVKRRPQSCVKLLYVASVNNTHSAVGGLMANRAYGSLEIVLPKNGNQADVCAKIFPWSVFTGHIMSGYYGFVRDNKKL